MNRFITLCEELAGNASAAAQEAALIDYLSAASPADAKWAERLLMGERLERAVTSAELRNWVIESAMLPDWLLNECHQAVGAWAQTLALVHPEPATPCALPLYLLIEERVDSLKDLDKARRKAPVLKTWTELTAKQRWLYQQLLAGELRDKPPRVIVARALARIAGLPTPAVDTRRLLAVLISVENGAGPGAGGHTEYGFAIWDGTELVPIARTAAELATDEAAEVERIAEANTTGRFGPVRSVKPELVFELSFEGVEKAKRRKAGLVLQNPRIARRLPDRAVAEAADLQSIGALLVTEHRSANAELFPS